MATKTPRREGIEVYRASDGWRWRLSRKGRTIADGSEAYASKGNALRAAKGVYYWFSAGVVTVWVRED